MGELVPDAPDGENVPGTTRIKLELRAQARDVHAEVMRLVVVLASPDALEEPLARHDAARVRGELVQQRELRGRERDRAPVHGDAMAREVDPEATDLHRIVRVSHETTHPAQQRIEVADERADRNRRPQDKVRTEVERA